MRKSTGFKDKNGREILDGDYIKITDKAASGSCIWIPYCHVWQSSHDLEWIASHNHDYSENSSPLKKVGEGCEVIGNSTDNPSFMQDRMAERDES